MRIQHRGDLEPWFVNKKRPQGPTPRSHAAPRFTLSNDYVVVLVRPRQSSLTHLALDEYPRAALCKMPGTSSTRTRVVWTIRNDMCERCLSWARL